MPPARRDLQLLLVAGGLAVVAGVFVAVVLLLTSGRSETPREYEPFPAGREEDLRRQLLDGGPFFVADFFGGNRSILFALEDGEVVALAVSQRSHPGCSVKWKDQLDRFVCGDERFTSDELERFAVRVPEAGDNEGMVLVDLRRRLPAPAPS